MTGPDGLDWLRQAVGRDYRLERELGAPGEDFVRVLARDLSLDRPVELLALRPEATTEAGTALFLAWARRLARINHPNVAGVYRAEVLRGVPCFALEHLAGETLAARLRVAPLGAREAIRLGRDVLRGLEASHAVGVARPGLNAETIVGAAGRGVLVDLGRARVEPAAVAADLHAAAAAMYAAVTGRVWDPTLGDVAWRPVPRRVRPVLRRALATRPEDRWPDAAGFRREVEALLESSHHWPWARVAGRAAVLAAAGGSVWLLWSSAAPWRCRASPGAVPKELALLPLEGAGDSRADTLGFAIANIVQFTLDNLPGLARTPWREVVRYWERSGHAVEGASAARDLKVRWAAHGLLTQRGDSLGVRLTIYDRRGTRQSLPEVHATVGTFTALADTVGVQLVRALAPELEPLYAPLPDLSGVPLGALKAFFQGEAAFARDEWELAERNYQIASREDTTFALPGWRLENVRRWRRDRSPSDLPAFYRRHGARLRPLDRALVEGLLEPDVARRIARLRAAVAMAPGDAYARFLYADELFHRGPLVGRDMGVAAREMGEVIALDSSFADAYNHLFSVYVRAGRRAEAARVLQLRRCVALRSAPGDLDKLAWLRLAYLDRFVPWAGALGHRWLAWRSTPATLGEIAQVARIATPWFDIPATQVALDRLLLERHAATDSARASARTGMALGLMALGRPEAALLQLDSAVALFPTAEATLQQAEWRAVPQLVGLPLTRSAAEPAWDARLDALGADPATAARALWGLALRRIAVGDTAGFERARARLESAGAGSPLAVLLRAVGQGARGHATVALAIADSIRPVFAVDHPPDPFAGVVFHVLRADWLAARGDRAGAEREAVWYEGSDFVGWPVGSAQAGEIEGAFAPYARWRRGAARLARATTAADTVAACALLERTRTLWRRAEPAMDAARADLDRQTKACPR
ncbi:MAG: hypothetical protein ABIY46_00670 [Gemmatimonadales bacterium]